ncbi:unnamed protein product, partial [Phaeothamnion confervicola]
MALFLSIRRSFLGAHPARRLAGRERTSAGLLHGARRAAIQLQQQFALHTSPFFPSHVEKILSHLIRCTPPRQEPLVAEPAVTRSGIVASTAKWVRPAEAV